MKLEEPQTIAILGRLPALSLAELESVYGSSHIRRAGNTALLDIPAAEIAFQKLGGTLKIGKILTVLPTTVWPDIARYLDDNVPAHAAKLPEGKLTLGLSAYQIDVHAEAIKKTLLQLKKTIKKTGRAVRVVPNKEPALNTAQVLHNKLTHHGAWELLAVRDGKRTIIAQTVFAQDIEDYAARDQGRPMRDAEVGMLPPKLAQTIINLARPTGSSTLLDPFCGSGVILQEGLLMGLDVIGTDISPTMIRYSQANIEWLKERWQRATGDATMAVGDATTHQWPTFAAIASETYLGPPLKQLPAPDKLESIISEVNELLVKTLTNIARQAPHGTRLCLAIPAWRSNTTAIQHLPLLDQLTDLGYNRISFAHAKSEELIYYREDQTVARELVVLQTR